MSDERRHNRLHTCADCIFLTSRQPQMYAGNHGKSSQKTCCGRLERSTHCPPNYHKVVIHATEKPRSLCVCRSAFMGVPCVLHGCSYGCPSQMLLVHLGAGVSLFFASVCYALSLSRRALRVCWHTLHTTSRTHTLSTRLKEELSLFFLRVWHAQN